MSNVVLKHFKNSFLGIDFKVFIKENEPYFIGNDVAKRLELRFPRQAIERYVKDKHKMPFYKLFSDENEMFSLDISPRLHPNTTIIDEFAFYNLCMRSSIDEIEPFQDWVCETIVSIRKGTTPTLEDLPPNNPLEMIRQLIIPQIPKYDKKGRNIERKAICKALKEAYDSAKNPPNVKSGRKGGLKTQEDIRELKESFYNLKSKVEKSIKKFETELEIVLEEISSSSERRSSSDSEY